MGCKHSVADSAAPCGECTELDRAIGGPVDMPILPEEYQSQIVQGLGWTLLALARFTRNYGRGEALNLFLPNALREDVRCARAVAALLEKFQHLLSRALGGPPPVKP